ncbi:phage holin family protein [Goodfellowiella coeruleoviolacea]|uniref:Holin-X, holin superfamily III n=1 Tax=Goodfellowiella coeruleoviolacea TaxID=334858 RepID=A0AAE3KGN5_9PSEU|nr:phage holin family protein [Goodfellowiella coeruleoviolacea]MCP2166400.1 putative Holin-X, holin superfamily III [Goodfellowiella coeruleoviolacea]
MTTHETRWHASTRPEDRPIGQLVSDMSEQLTRLVRDEMRIAALEMRQKGKRLGRGAGLLSGAGVLALYGGGAVIAGLIMLLATAITPWVAAIIVGVALLIIAGVFALAGRSSARRAVPPLPEQAVSDVRRDMQMLKERAHG